MAREKIKTLLLASEMLVSIQRSRTVGPGDVGAQRVPVAVPAIVIFEMPGSAARGCSLAAMARDAEEPYYCACSPDVTVTSLHPSRLCRLAVLSIKPTLLSHVLSV